ncbi:MAG TPA: helix-turn-helix domain-containing protein, partial [Victivallales bacterium]|nr:helix-turn-helix domain-containing protein [Victivallales bacterium]
MYYKDKIIYNRKLKKLTIKQVAKYLSTGEKTIWNWENGRTQPSKTDLIALSVLFDIPLCEISDYDNLTIFSSTNKNTTQSCTVDGAINIINNIIKKYGDVPEVSISALNKLNNELVNMSKKNQRLTKALNRNNVLFDTINSILYIKDKNRSLIKVNNAFINSIPGNYSLEDIIGSKVIDILGRKEIEELIILENSVFETGLLVIDELIKIPGSNGKKQGLVSIKPVFDKSNDVNEITVCIKDVTRLNEIIEKQSMLTNT